jgi:hypothetical protein
VDKAKGDTTTKDDDKALAPSRLRQCAHDGGGGGDDDDDDDWASQGCATSR